MNLPAALGIALAALTVAGASAQSSRHVEVRGGHSDISIDANEDGWITRNEASSAFERIYADLDSNNDGRLDDGDRREFRVHIDGPDVQILEGGNGRRVRVIAGDVDDDEIEGEIERAIAQAERDVERAERDAERAERHAERAEREAERHAERAERNAERHIERHVIRRDNGDQVIIIRRGGGAWSSEDGDEFDIAPVPPIPPVPPVPPLPPAPYFMMLIANSDEADRNGDGALSREEFRDMHLRFFDASDVNGDGRVRFEEPPAPPTPPTPPTPPEPPRRR